MNKQNILIGLAVVLAAIYVFSFTDWTAKKEIQIKYTNLRVPDGSGGPNILFLFEDKRYRLASVKVVSMADATTNKYPHALWHMVAKNYSSPVKSFPYGLPIAGMKPDIAQARPEPLISGEKYRLILETDKKERAQINFEAP